ncbi:MAG: amidohydrolase family protein [Spirochaetales bacterium]|nr:amidohydrolase family protein [Spirochaetales bacterium]
MSRILIKNGIVTDEQSSRKADILIKDEHIETIGLSIDKSVLSEGDRLIDAQDMIVMPGAIDAHTHYHLVSRGTVTCDSFAEGSRLAAFGGVTTVVDFADHNRGQGLVESLEYRLNEMRPGMAIDYTLHQGVYGHGYNSTIGKQLEDLKKKGVKTLKIFTTYRNTGYLIENKDDLLDLFTNAKRLGMLVCAHCEFNPMIEEISDNWKGDFSPASHALLRPAEAEGKAIELFGSIALQAGCPLYVVHCSSECGLNAIRELRKKGLTVYAETTPTYLFLDKSYLDGPDGSLYVMTPPLREKSDNRALREALRDGEIQVLATDHCAFTREQKLSSSDCRTIYPGIPGTEEILLLLNTLKDETEGMTMSDVVRLVSANPAKLFGIYPRKGSLEVGTDADITIFDPNERWTLEDEKMHSASHYTPYRHFGVHGKVKATILRGSVIMENGEYYGQPGEGRFIEQN